MEQLIKSVTDHYKERIQRLALFDPLYTLSNKRGKDHNGNPIDYFSLGLLTLLFFFEAMLMRQKKTGIKEVAQFLYHLNRDEMSLAPEDFEKIAQEIIHVFRPPGGKRNAKTFYNWETRQEETIYFSILKTAPFDPKDNAQYYVLDEQGLELIFATKEYFSEFQLSINQLVLRKQLEKGEFVGALRQIDEMRMNVETLKNKIFRIKHEIQRNIISDETYQRYQTIVEDINLRLTHENEEFEELQTFIRETKERLGYHLEQEKEKKAYQLILQIDQELGEVHYSHRQLLQESIVLKTTALQAAQESLYYVGISSFNFQDQITNRLFSAPLPLEASRRLAAPFLYLERAKVWSPLAVFFKQRLEKEEEQTDDTAFPEQLTEELLKEHLQIQRQNFRQVTEIVLEGMGDNREITLAEVISYLETIDKGRDFLANRSFYDYWILLHQLSPLKVDLEEPPPLLAEAMELFKAKTDKVTMMELPDILSPLPRYTIQNMRLSLEDEEA
ncbi:MAG: replicative DNA helicase [Clostridia bacterium]|jgi:hypothetical protein|nr:replicative DNA helicase [Clostridia bacterium]